MARSRRRSVPRGTRGTDWVYRSNLRGLTSAPFNAVDSLGTYEFQVRSLTSGFATAQALWLVDAADRENSVAVTSTTQAALQSKAAKPEGPRTRVLEVEGHIYIEPSTWAAGNLMAVGIRICALEQDIVTGLASVDPDMTMWLNTGVGYAGAAAVYANDRQLNMHEQRAYKGFSDNQTFMVVHVRAKTPWTLQSHHGLALWLEAESTSVNVRYQTWLRTRVMRT